MNDPRLDPVQLHITATNELARVLRALRGPCADYDAIYERMARAMGALETLRIIDAHGLNMSEPV